MEVSERAWRVWRVERRHASAAMPPGSLRLTCEGWLVNPSRRRPDLRTWKMEEDGPRLPARPPATRKLPSRVATVCTSRRPSLNKAPPPSP